METKKHTRLKSHLDSHGIRQTFVANKVGVTQAWMNKIVNGSEPKIGQGLKIAEALELDPKWLWEECIIGVLDAPKGD